MAWIIGILALIVLLPLLRVLGVILLFVAVVVILASSGTSSQVTVSAPVTQVRPLTYQELVDYPLNCEQADSQLSELKAIQARYNFDSDVDSLTPDNRAWNSIIKSNIWWFAYRCNKS